MEEKFKNFVISNGIDGLTNEKYVEVNPDIYDEQGDLVVQILYESDTDELIFYCLDEHDNGYNKTINDFCEYTLARVAESIGLDL